MINEILETIKDTKRDYVGMNGCLYQDLDRKELNIILDYINNLQQRIDKAIEYIRQIDDFDIKDFRRMKLLKILGSDNNE